MTFIRALDSEFLTDHKLLKMSSFASMLSELVLQEAKVTPVMKSLAQYSKAFGSSYGVSYHEARVTSVARDLVSCELV